MYICKEKKSKKAFFPGSQGDYGIHTNLTSSVMIHWCPAKKHSKLLGPCPVQCSPTGVQQRSQKKGCAAWMVGQVPGLKAKYHFTLQIATFNGLIPN